MNMVAILRRLFLALVISNTALHASAQSLDGLCLDTVEEGCMPRFLPFYGNSVDFCEETCSLEKPVNVRGLDGVLYDLSCRADYDTPLDGLRIMLLTQMNWEGRRSMYWISANGTIKIVACP